MKQQMLSCAAGVLALESICWQKPSYRRLTFSRRSQASEWSIVKRTRWLIILAGFLVWSPNASRAAEALQLVEGDRVVFLGNTLIEREQRYGYWETMLTARF